MKSTEYEEGYDSYWDGDDFEQSPYLPSDGGSFSDWNKGWLDAKEERKND